MTDIIYVSKPGMDIETANQYHAVYYKKCTNDEVISLIHHGLTVGNFKDIMVGISASDDREFILPGSYRLSNWTSDIHNIPYYRSNCVICERPTLSSGAYCRKHNLPTLKETHRFDIYLPFVKRIGDSYSIEWMRKTGQKLMMRIFYLNNVLHECWTKYDFLKFAHIIFFKFIARPLVFDVNGILQWLSELWDTKCRCPYEDLVKEYLPLFDCSQKLYRSQRYFIEAYEEIVKAHLVNEMELLFINMNDVNDVCAKHQVGIKNFRAWAKKHGYQFIYSNFHSQCMQKHRKNDVDVII